MLSPLEIKEPVVFSNGQYRQVERLLHGRESRLPDDVGVPCVSNTTVVAHDREAHHLLFSTFLLELCNR